MDASPSSSGYSSTSPESLDELPEALQDAPAGLPRLGLPACGPVGSKSKESEEHEEEVEPLLDDAAASSSQTSSSSDGQYSLPHPSGPVQVHPLQRRLVLAMHHRDVGMVNDTLARMMGRQTRRFGEEVQLAPEVFRDISNVGWFAKRACCVALAIVSCFVLWMLLVKPAAPVVLHSRE